jgi:hypothetical protein
VNATPPGIDRKWQKSWYLKILLNLFNLMHYYLKLFRCSNAIYLPSEASILGVVALR